MRSIKYVVIHHAAVVQDNADLLLKSCNVSHRKRLHEKANVLGNYCAYHYIIWRNWKILHTRSLNEIGYHASNRRINTESVWICLCGNLDIQEPSQEQLQSLKGICLELQKQFWKLIIEWHNKFASYKSCPWKNFNVEDFKIYLNKKEMVKKWSDKLAFDLGLRNWERADEPISRKEVAIMMGRLVKLLNKQGTKLEK